MYIKSLDNNIIKHVNSLKKPAGRREFFELLLEGERLVHDSVLNGAQLSFALVSENYKGFIPKECKVYTLPDKLFHRIAETETPQGIIAVAKQKKWTLDDIEGAGPLVICDNVRDPGNMGTILRIAHATGASGVVLLKGCVDIYNTKVVRASMSALFQVKTVFLEPCDLKDVKQKDYKIAGGALQDRSVSLYSANLKGKWAFVIGNEGDGISPEVLDACDTLIKIPMPGGAESLNAAVACAVMLYEHVRVNL